MALKRGTIIITSVCTAIAALCSALVAIISLWTTVGDPKEESGSEARETPTVPQQEVKR